MDVNNMPLSTGKISADTVRRKWLIQTWMQERKKTWSSSHMCDVCRCAHSRSTRHSARDVGLSLLAPLETHLLYYKGVNILKRSCTTDRHLKKHGRVCVLTEWWHTDDQKGKKTKKKKGWSFICYLLILLFLTKHQENQPRRIIWITKNHPFS